jgi:hypothetical protein
MPPGIPRAVPVEYHLQSYGTNARDFPCPGWCCQQGYPAT